MQVLFALVAAFGFLCSVAIAQSEDPCGGDLNLNYYNGNCYWFGFQPVSWEKANSTCADRRSHLVSIRDRATNAYLQFQAYPNDFWFGLSKNDEGNFVWSDEPHTFNDQSFSDWSDKVPSTIGGKCAQMVYLRSQIASHYQVGWTMTSCDLLRPFVCVSPAPSTQGLGKHLL